MADQIIEQIKNNSLTSLEVDANDFLGNTGIELLDALGNNTSITHFNIKNGGRLIKSFENLIQYNHTITHLDLSGNNLGNLSLNSLFSAIADNPALEHISLGSNNLEEHQLTLALATLPYGTTRKSAVYLDLAGNSIGNETAVKMAGLMIKNTAISGININSYQLGDEAAIAWAEALKQNTTLTALNLGGSFGEEGIIALAGMLKTNTTLNSISFTTAPNLELNEFAPALREMFKTNTTLTHFNMEGLDEMGSNYLWKIYNDIKASGSKNIIDFNTKNSGILNICFDNRELAEALAQKIKSEPATLTAADLPNIMKRLPAIKAVAEECGLSEKELNLAIALLQNAPLPPIEKPAPATIITASQIRKQIAASTPRSIEL